MELAVHSLVPFWGSLMLKRLQLTKALLGTLLCTQALSAAPAFNYLPAPADVSVGVAGAWVDVDVSTYVPPGATGVLVLVRNPTAGDRAYGIRKNGSTDPWESESTLINSQQTWLMTGLDPDGVFEIYAENTALEFYLYAYTMNSVQFLTDRIDKSVAPSAWTDVDITADTGVDTAIGAVFTVLNRSGSAQRFALRRQGSGDDRYSALEKNAATLGLIGVDGADQAEMRIESSLVDLYLVGYVTHGAVFIANGVDKSTSSAGAYQDVDITADIGGNRVNGAFVELHSTNDSAYQTALRRNGDTEDFYLDQTHAFASIGVDSANIFEQKVGDTQRDLYLVGYSLDPPVWYRSIGTAPDYVAGTVSATAGSAIVTGTGVAWQSANRGRGDRIDIGGTDYVILSVDSEAQLTLTQPAATSFSGPYTISRQYPTMPAWEDCVDGGPCSYFPVASSDLVADDRMEVGVAYNDAPFTDPLVIDGATTDASHPIILTAAVRNRHRGVAGTGVVIDLSTGAEAVLIEDAFVTVEWLEITGSSGSPNAFETNSQNASNQIVIRNNIIHDMPRDGLELRDADTNIDFFNNILYTLGRSGVRMTSQPNVGRFFNNTVYNCAAPGFEGTGNASTFLRNNIAHSNTTADFAVTPVAATSSDNFSGDATGIAHSPLGGGMDNVPLANFLFISTTPGTEDLHIIAGSAAEDAGTDLSSFFLVDIDGANRSSPWDIGADDVLAGGAPRISSATAQSFTVGDPDTPAALVTITDDPGAATITAVKDLRIRIPAGFNMRWDSSVTSVALGGSAFAKVDPTIKAYEDLDQTVVLDVVTDFSPGDFITIDLLQFFSFTAPSPLDNLELEVANDGLASALDDKTIAIAPSANPSLSSFDHQFFTVGPGPSPAESLFISEGAVAFINATDDIRIHIPGSLAMEWNTTLTSAIIGGNAASKVSTTVSYASPTILVINVTAPFAPGEFISVSGLEFVNFAAPGVGNLELEVDNFGTIVGFDDKVITITDATDVPFFTATATNNQVKLEWVNPFFGACDNTHVVRNTVQPTGPFDGLSIDVRSCVGLPGQKQDVIDGSPVNGTKYHYAIFVEYGAAMFTAGKFLRARPFNSLPGPVKWAYSTGAASMAPPGLRFFAGVAYVYAVSNDGVLHSVNGDGTGGDWPAGWIPFALGAPAQARPPVVPFAVGGATSGAAFVGAQNGVVYAVDAVSGMEEWSQSIASMVQAAPAGNFLFYNALAKDLILVGTRSASSPNTLEALDVTSGTPVWSFDNSAAYGGDDTDIGIISGGASVDYANRRVIFTSREKSGGSSNTVWCIDFDSGLPSIVWAKAYGNIDGSPILLGTTVYVGTNAGVVYALDAATGDVNWSLPLADGVIKSFIFPQFGSINLFASTNGKIWSIADSGGSGAVNPGWPVTSAEVPSPSTPLYVPGSTMVIAGSGDGNLYQMDVITPLPTTSVTLGDGTAAVGAPTMDLLNSMIYVGSDEGVIYGVEFPLP